jgi:hypothetical protein
MEDIAMDPRKSSILKRIILSLAAGAALSGCVYAPPYAYDAAPVGSSYYYPYAYDYPTYVGPPLSLNFGYYHSHRSGSGWRDHGWRGGRSGYGGYRGGGRGRR